MKQIVLVILFGVFCAVLAAPAEAGCYQCNTSYCCDDAPSGFWGKKYCNNSNNCGPAGCNCWNCSTHGDSCEGTGSGGSCTEGDGSPGGCIQNKAFLLTPNGQAIEGLGLNTLAATGLPSTGEDSPDSEAATWLDEWPDLDSAECTSG